MFGLDVEMVVEDEGAGHQGLGRRVRSEFQRRKSEVDGIPLLVFEVSDRVCQLVDEGCAGLVVRARVSRLW